MSIEYTIDIQLTELGFPDILQPQEPSVRAAPSQPPTTRSSSHKRLLSLGGEGAGPEKQKPGSQQTTVCSSSSSSSSSPSSSSSSHCKRPTSAQSLHEGHAAPATAPGTTGGPRRTTAEEGGGQRKGFRNGGDAAQGGSAEAQQGVEDDSDDSEVSDMYEEEECDEEEDCEEEEEEEEGPNNESSLSSDYRCSVCDLQLPSKHKLQDHMNLHTGARPYCCAECGKRFCQNYNYRVHLRTHAQTKVDRLLCRVCLMGFSSQEDLKDHLSKTHFEKQFFECDLCKRVFTSLKACESHVLLHKGMLDVVCKVCGRNFPSPKSLARHRKKTCHRFFKCTDCTKTFTKKNALLKHSFSHLGLLPYTCIRCRCHFRLVKLYRKHKCEPERIHCVACLREFLSQQDFQQHKRDTGCWGNQEPKGDEIRCLECGEMFDSSEELKKHAGAHQRVLKCAECGKGFRSALLLMSHMGGHVGKSPCLCQSCGLGFPHQQNYDSHLKTCGQTPRPASAHKKHQASKNSSSETKKLSAKPDTSSPANMVSKPATVSNKPARPVKESVRPGLVTGDVSSGSGPADGLWKLTLDKQPPPGVEFVLYLPVCPPETTDQPLSPAASSHPGVNAALGVQLDAPQDLVSGIKEDPEGEAPLDLSKKINSSKFPLSDIPLRPIKNEPEVSEISIEANGAERQDRKSSDSRAVVKTNPGESDSEMKQLQVDPMDLSPQNTSSELIMDIKKEPQSYGYHFDLGTSRSCQLTDWSLEKEIKTEVDISHPACADKEK
ncbi:zinc finger protein 668 isoform X1 [Scophthalmus maximus]|uniref:zinc finger protein 668 isoform X1 n=1 Tax=Scophthalmus maximus TaxID=52904 RepID=UPI001FA8339C|nr:zinc finger protein 668 isoform X1 [Scophthalmus maximus]XP_035480709.2 zinc finger protein 668 isoform X1 [Scophthalmus maximus]